MSVQPLHARHSLRSLAALKGREGVAMLTAYDVVTASLLDAAGADLLLAGDSVGNVVYGFDSTLPVNLDMILAHTKAVVRGSQRAFVVADLPFMTYQADVAEALRSAGRCLAEAGAQAVKLEGASEHVLTVVRRMVESGIPVMGHVGLTPQSVHQMGGYYTHGKTEAGAERILREALELQAAGCFAVVLECIEPALAARVTAALSALTIGIGSGTACDGQVLVINDLLGYSPGKAPRFARARLDMKALVSEAARDYVAEVKAARAPRAAEIAP